ncbi:hypothetical protein GV829_04550 [Sphingomonas lacunae]|uniref:Uncharacterized protein n=1 Tax=Sphingomonas lacunae TaxID=2698828 RepID=A0A6M4ARX4_9SPHN|nr:hypothetical protein [Sphingomonas lacunae]QJQ31805.1 hypothetical protein GV829_04550 [Sphingomonas lacunae]
MTASPTVIDPAALACERERPENTALACERERPENTALACERERPENTALACERERPENTALACERERPDFITARLHQLLRENFGLRCPVLVTEEDWYRPLGSFPGIIETDLVNFDIGIERAFGIAFTLADFAMLERAGLADYVARVRTILHQHYSFTSLTLPVAWANRDPIALAPGGDGPLAGDPVPHTDRPPLSAGRTAA